MNVRTLFNVAYSAIVENMEEKERLGYDDLLDSLHKTWLRASRGEPKAPPREETIEEKRRRMFRLVPDRSRELMATMGQFRG